MDKIKFVATSFWDRSTMSLDSQITKEQWERVEKVTEALDDKYKFEQGCFRHPEQIHKISVNIFNNYVNIQVWKPDTCGCQKIVERLLAIRDAETGLLNKS